MLQPHHTFYSSEQGHRTLWPVHTPLSSLIAQTSLFYFPDGQHHLHIKELTTGMYYRELG